MNRVTTHDIELAWDEIGRGDPTILVVPQWFLSSRSMRASALVRKLADHHRMLLYDRRGTGSSDKPGPPYTTARDSRDLAGMFEALSLEGIVMLGHGVRGSQVAMHFAGHFPKMVRAVICIGGTPRWRAGPAWPYGLNDGAWDAAFGKLESSNEPPPGASLAMNEDWEAAGREGALDILVHTRDEDLRHFLRKVTAPTLIVHLREEGLVPFEAAQWLAESLPHGVLEVFDAPREIPFRAHEELAAHIEEFLRTAG